MLNIQNGFAFDSTAFGPTGVPLIRIRDLKSGTSTETKYAGDFDSRYIVNAGDLLVGMDGEFGCYEWKGEPALLNQRVCRLHGFGHELEPRFLLYGINAHLKAIEKVTGYTTVKHLSSKQILGIEMLIPPRAEQHRIVDTLDEAFDGIATAKANAEKNLQNARELANQLLNALFTRIAVSAERRRLGEVCAFVRGPFGGSLKKDCFVEDGYAVYEQSHAIYDQFSEVRYFVNEAKFGEMRRFELRPNDLIMSCSGTMGRVAIAPPGLRRGIINQALLKLTPSRDVESKFLKHWMSSRDFQDALAQCSGGAAIQNVASVSVLKGITLPLPSVPDQRVAVSQLERLAAQVERLQGCYERKILAIDELKESLLHQAFTGALSAKSTDRQLEAVA